MDDSEPTDDADDLDDLLALFELKDERRTGWQLRGVEAPESVAAHTWGTATLCLLFADRAGVDRDRAVATALVHDLAEAETGDVATRAEAGRQAVPPEEKAAAERAAIEDLLGPFSDGVGAECGDESDDGSGAECGDESDGGSGAGTDEGRTGAVGDDLLALWADYEARETPTARFVKDMDLLDMCLQALSYERGDRYDDVDPDDHFEAYDDLDEFFATAAPRVRTPVGEALFERVRSAYEEEIGRECEL
jgi:putative hydrolase of HD superfamily